MTGSQEFYEEWKREHFAEGRAQGLAEGRALGFAKVLVVIYTNSASE